MADNVIVNPGSGGATFATDDIAGVHYSRSKTTWGPDGTANDADIASGKPLPIQVRTATGLIPLGEPTDAKSTATDGTSASLVALLKQISQSAQDSARKAATSTLSNVSASATSVTVLASNANRMAAVIVNDSAANVYIKFGSTASATSFTYKLLASDTIEISGHAIYTGIITGIWDSATGAARVTELTA